MFHLLSLLATVSAISVTLNGGDNIGTSCLSVGSMYQWKMPGCYSEQIPERIDCLGRDEDFLRSVFQCMANSRHTLNLTSAEITTSLNQMPKGSLRKTKISLREVQRLYAEVAAEPTFPLGDVKTVASQPISFRRDYISNMYQRNEAILQNRGRSDIYGAIVLGFWAGIMVLKAIEHLVSQHISVISRTFDIYPVRVVRRFVTLPAMFGLSHSMPYKLGYFTFSFPKRFKAVIIIAFVVVNYVMMFFNIPQIPERIYMYSDKAQYSNFLADRAAKLMLFKLPLCMFFATRNNFLSFFTGFDLNDFNVFHKWVGRITFIDVIIHAAAATVYLSGHHIYVAMMKYTLFLKFGTATIIVLALLIFQSIHWLRAINYEVFKYLHIFLSILFFAFIWQHISGGAHSGYEYMYACWAVWIFDHVGRWFRIIVSGENTKGNFIYHGGALEITLEYSQLWKPLPGHYAFIHVLGLDSFWESHPFALMRATKEGEEGKLKMIIRAKDGITKRWVERCIRSGGVFESYVFMDGPYGISHNLYNYKEVVFIAGGIGISGPYSYLQTLIRKGDPEQILSLYWGIPNEEPLAWFSNELEYLGASGRVEVFIFIGLDGSEQMALTDSSDKSIKSMKEEKSYERHSSKTDFSKTQQPCVATRTTHNGRVHFYDYQMSLPWITHHHLEESRGPLCFFTCGPPSMSDQARQSYTKGFMSSKYPSQYYEEHYSW